MESTTNPTAAAAVYSIDGALRALATTPHYFVLRAVEQPIRQVTLEFAPLPPGDAEPHRFRREVRVSRLGRIEREAAAVGAIDLARRVFVGGRGDGVDVQVRNAVALPATATIGDGGPAFRTVGRSADGAGGPERTNVSWHLEPWDGGRALWTLRMQPDAPDGVTTTEGYVIDRDGRIHGAVMRVNDDAAGRSIEMMSHGLVPRCTSFDDPRPGR